MNFLKRKLTVILLSLFFLLFFPQNIFALSISPIRQEMFLDPGASKDISLQIENSENKDLLINFKVLGVKQGTDGQPLFGEKSSPAESWVTVPEKIILHPKEKQKVNFKLVVPNDIYPTLYNLALVASIGAGDQGVGLGTDLASLLSIQIAGQAQEKLKISDWSVVKRFTNDKNWQFNLVLKNLSNVRLGLAGDLSLFNLHGQRISQQDLLLGSDLLPGAERIVKPAINLVDTNLQAGIYQAEVKIAYGQTRQLVVSKIYVIYLSRGWYYLLGGLLVLILVGLVGWRYKKSRIR